MALKKLLQVFWRSSKTQEVILLLRKLDDIWLLFSKNPLHVHVVGFCGRTFGTRKKVDDSDRLFFLPSHQSLFYLMTSR